MSIVARFFPNGEFTLGVATTKRRDKRTHPLEGYEKCRDEEGQVYLRWQRRDVEVKASLRYSFVGREYISALSSQIYLCVDMDEKLRPTFYWQDSDGKEHEGKFSLPIGQYIRSGELRELGSSDSRILEKQPESRKKLLTMTKSMARNLRNAVYLMEDEHGKDQLSFLTLTIPSLPPSELEAICQQWGSLTNQILKWIQYKCEKQEMAFEYAYCTEIQEKRLETRGEYAPHLHIVFRGKNGKAKNWAISPKQVRTAWLRLLSTCVGHSVKSNSVENLQVVRKSAARYLSKYVSKGVRHRSRGLQGTYNQRLRTHWGGMSRELSRRIKAGCRRIGGTGEQQDIAVLLSRSLPHLVGGRAVKFYRESFIPIGQYSDSGNTRFLRVGVGCLTSPLNKGSLESLITESVEWQHDKEIKDLLNSLDSFWFN